MTRTTFRTGVILKLALIAGCSGAAGPPSAPKVPDSNPARAMALSEEKKEVAPAPNQIAPRLAVGWRNDGSGRFPNATPPVEWDENKNILWTTRIGPNKYSSPIVVERKLFVVAEPAWLFCVDAADGKILWKKSCGFADLPEKTPEKPPRGSVGNTTPTPVSDGQYVYVLCATGIVACFDMKGERQWIRYFDLNPATEYGRSTSPLLAGGKLLVTLSHLIALDARTGKEAWRNKEVPELYGTPVAARIAKVDVAVMPSGHVVRIEDGVILAGGLGGLNFASAIVQEDTVYLMQTGTKAHRLSAAAANKWEAKQLWEEELEGTFYASAVYDKGLIYAVSNENIFQIVDAANGKVLASKELDLPTANIYPSVTLAGNLLFVLNDHGDALVLEPGKGYKELKRNRLGEGHGGGPTFDGKNIYIRSGQNLYCIGEK